MSKALDHTRRDRWTDEPAVLPQHALAALATRWGTGGAARAPEATISEPAWTEPAGAGLSSQAQADLVAAVGPRHVLTDLAARAGRAGGLSYLDLLRRRLGQAPPLPDVVLTPADPDQVQAVLAVCRRHDLAVVPFGGGTSVVGGVAALRGAKPLVVALDLHRLDRLVRVDTVSRLAVLQAGVRGPDAERLLAGHGLTLGHVPQSFERATIGGFAATRSAGQASSGYGRFEDMVYGVRLATPAGEWSLGRAPASAAGPDLTRLVLGSEGALGVITEVTVRVRPVATHQRYEGLVVDGWRRGLEAMRALAQGRALADVTRLSDLAETDLGLALPGGLKAALVRRYLSARGVGEPCLLILGWEGASDREVATRRAATLRVLRRWKPVSLGQAAGRRWRHGRFAGPRQRDALMAAGVCVETLETAACWSALPELATGVRAALSAALGPAVVLCHVSHAYETGASLYFTVLAPRDPDDPVGQWQRAKDEASQVIMASEATITHHHAVGTDHLPWLDTEIGGVGLEVLRAVKAATDPTGIMNPGKLLRG